MVKYIDQVRVVTDLQKGQTVKPRKGVTYNLRHPVSPPHRALVRIVIRNGDDLWAVSDDGIHRITGDDAWILCPTVKR